ncbi:MAG TPA: hypothetical protein DDW94_06220 [Deltaproteobacteria bacterium]|nr:MAG: hypothetical protein A2Z79_00750 [Deltaproteobacteria bacterium GWA2_55_82]OGQ64904.1 MAG: hypothetical protein A3I81_04860 [Deltaproteobacteria bacterium RIFCSPLOWO2_02_FULL_55_12]OIJ73972.1 MAG: hypothetical protein A2V21_306655 [Deltaproteobacteria bacterium GWC2_55_46]HBG46572.1 hypothetical protein [Deltaproteobacteria bacterium]HCY09974.1 hypothetical protein [Deltaproteobacteria bacterium]
MGKISKTSFFAFLLAFAASPAFADVMCNYGDTQRLDVYLKKGREAEKEGKPLNAILFFQAADEYCGNRDEARRGIMRIGARMGAAAAAKGRLFANRDILTTVPDEDCRRWSRNYYLVPNPYEPPVPGLCTTKSGGMRVQIEGSAGAYDWYEATFNYRESDALVLKVLRSSPHDFGAYEAAQRHFKKRHQLNHAGYTLDTAHLMELRKTASSNVTAILLQEQKDLAAPKEADRSLSQLEAALKWASYAGEEETARVIKRAIDRGDDALMEKSITDLHEALEYYSFAEKMEKVRMVEMRADELGMNALSDNDPGAALNFFMLSGNRGQAEKARVLIETGPKAATGKKTAGPTPAKKRP